MNLAADTWGIIIDGGRKNSGLLRLWDALGREKKIPATKKDIKWDC